ncbi:hypothetical protein ACJX0J_019933, partial [Zea mays]
MFIIVVFLVKDYLVNININPSALVRAHGPTYHGRLHGVICGYIWHISFTVTKAYFSILPLHGKQLAMSTTTLSMTNPCI